MKKPKKEMTITEAIPNYREYLALNGKKAITVAAYTRDLNVAASFFGDTPISKIMLPRVGVYLKSKALNGPEDAPYGKVTVSRSIRTFRQFMEWAHANRITRVLPLPKATLAKKKGAKPASKKELFPKWNPKTA